MIRICHIMKTIEYSFSMYITQHSHYRTLISQHVFLPGNAAIYLQDEAKAKGPLLCDKSKYQRKTGKSLT